MAPIKRSAQEIDELKCRIVAAATKAFALQGIRSVHMDNLAAMVGISKRTLYELFSDKEELLLTVFENQYRQMEIYMAEVASGAENVLEVLFAFYERKLIELADMNQQFFRDLRKYPKVLDYIRRYRKSVDRDALAYFRKGIEEGIFRPDINFDIINQAMCMQLDMMIYSDITENYPLAEIYTEITVLHLRGITTERGWYMVDSFLQRIKKNRNSFQNNHPML